MNHVVVQRTGRRWWTGDWVCWIWVEAPDGTILEMAPGLESNEHRQTPTGRYRVPMTTMATKGIPGIWLGAAFDAASPYRGHFIHDGGIDAGGEAQVIGCTAIRYGLGKKIRDAIP